jgi:predicted metal-binding protein
LAKVVVSWEKLPAPLKSAILAIIKSAEVMP